MGFFDQAEYEWIYLYIILRHIYTILYNPIPKKLGHCVKRK